MDGAGAIDRDRDAKNTPPARKRPRPPQVSQAAERGLGGWRRFGAPGRRRRRPDPAGADRPEPAARARPGFRQRLAHHPYAEGLAADAVAVDRGHHRPGDRPIRKHPRKRRLAEGSADRPAAARQPPPERGAAAQAADRRRRSRSQCRHHRYLRFLCRGGGAPLSGPPRHYRRRHRAGGELRPAQYSVRRAARRSSKPTWRGCAA